MWIYHERWLLAICTVCQLFTRTTVAQHYGNGTQLQGYNF
jgi:hypothetical protein